MSEIDWQAVFFRLHDLLMARARKRFGDTPDAESAYNYALDHLGAQGFDALGKKYSGRGSPEGFVVVTFVNAMHDYAIAKYGRPRPPVWLSRLGDAWKSVFEMLCMRRLLPETIVDTLSASTDIARDALHAMIREVRGRIPNCGSLSGGEFAVEDPAMLDAHGHHDAATALEAGDMATLVGALHGVLQPDTPKAATADEALGERLLPLRQTLRLNDIERLLLRLVYQRGYSISKAARALQLKDHNARRLHTRVLERLRSALGQCGLEPLA